MFMVVIGNTIRVFIVNNSPSNGERVLKIGYNLTKLPIRETPLVQE